ncbi:hypothetical protein NDU88_006134 [Pleurodeles waltl]|uniref:Uncharacterized protein n=1 Tax=Pleurodeles waltl TaxID=8319 RepID=A0AAV7VNV3_PLEWA|nr:hypothetical protein NDU88_006134 [Pleurodeles waltl]
MFLQPDLAGNIFQATSAQHQPSEAHRAAISPPRPTHGTLPPRPRFDRQATGVRPTRDRPNIPGPDPHLGRPAPRRPGPNTFSQPAPADTSGHSLGTPAPELHPVRGPNWPPMRPRQVGLKCPPPEYSTLRAVLMPSGPTSRVRVPGGGASAGAAGHAVLSGLLRRAGEKHLRQPTPGPPARTKEVTKGSGGPQRKSSARSPPHQAKCTEKALSRQSLTE